MSENLEYKIETVTVTDWEKEARELRELKVDRLVMVIGHLKAQNIQERQDIDRLESEVKRLTTENTSLHTEISRLREQLATQCVYPDDSTPVGPDDARRIIADNTALKAEIGRLKAEIERMKPLDTL